MSNIRGLRRKEWIRPWVAEMLGINPRQVSRLFGEGGKIKPGRVRAYIDSNGFFPPPLPRLEHVRGSRLGKK